MRFAGSSRFVIRRFATASALAIGLGFCLVGLVPTPSEAASSRFVVMQANVQGNADGATTDGLENARKAREWAVYWDNHWYPVWGVSMNEVCENQKLDIQSAMAAKGLKPVWVTTKNVGGSCGLYGNVIWVKHISSPSHGRCYLSYSNCQQPGAPSSSQERRAAVYAKANVISHAVWVLSTHLINGTVSGANTQSTKILNEYRNNWVAKEPRIAMGDYNQINGDNRDNWRKEYREAIATIKPTTTSGNHYDYIWVNSAHHNVAQGNATIGTLAYSDHYAVANWTYLK